MATHVPLAPCFILNSLCNKILEFARMLPTPYFFRRGAAWPLARANPGSPARRASSESSLACQRNAAKLLSKKRLTADGVIRYLAPGVS